eukprot:CAMPEP_0176468194 /NCGR_PEP_ID=MMETSP0127-20121128/38902_1 /TAXON_ID=938130 /ORGANISM="Platyophrya macrostoma, Strain WH" /LENGTH=112 /DNA_ID=CAMNT_0017861625 /DNA_START=18 /DNA_END=353 /DNA_ORIENTATION=+
MAPVSTPCAVKSSAVDDDVYRQRERDIVSSIRLDEEAAEVGRQRALEARKQRELERVELRKKTSNNKLEKSFEFRPVEKKASKGRLTQRDQVPKNGVAGEKKMIPQLTPGAW